MTRRLLALVLAPVLLLGFAGCGSDGGDALSADDYKAEANKVCEGGQARAEAIGKSLGDDPTEEEVTAALEKLADEVQGQVDDIRALQGPDDLESDVHEVLDDADDQLDDLRAKAKEDPMAAAESPAFDEINERLVDLGLDTCGAD